MPPAHPVPLLFQGLPGALELIIILMVLVIPLLVVGAAGVAIYLLFFRDDDDETADEPAGEAGTERAHEDP